MRAHRTFGLLTAFATVLTAAALGGLPGAAAGAQAAAAGRRAAPVAKQLAVLKGTSTVYNDRFGSAVAISGSTAVVGDSPAPGDHTPPGRAWVYAKIAGKWKQTAMLKGSDTTVGDEFGASVAVSGTTIVVGAADAADFDGRAYVFTKTATGWKQTAEAKESDPTNLGTDAFGTSVAISGSTIAVGAPDHPHGTGASQGFGETYVFTKSAAGWKQTSEIKGPRGSFSDGFGYSVAIAGTTLVAGAPYAATFAGRAYVFAKTATGWKQTAALKGSDTTTTTGLESGDLFGRSLAISGSTVVVGAPQHAGYAGRVYVFARNKASWKQTTELKYGGAGAEFGGRVAISGKALLGTTQKVAQPAILFVKTKTGWKRRTALKAGADDPAPAVAISGAIAIVGSPLQANYVGRAYVFES